jgi:hypothetical protein
MYPMMQNLPKELQKYEAHLVVTKLIYHQIEKHLMTQWPPSRLLNLTCDLTCYLT